MINTGKPRVASLAFLLMFFISPSNYADISFTEFIIDNDSDINILSGSNVIYRISWGENDLVTEISQNRQPSPQDPVRIYNYPNPFNDLTIIRYDLSFDSDVRIEIYDVPGREIETLVHGARPADSHRVAWNPANKPSGIYFCRIQAADFTKASRMVLMK